MLKNSVRNQKINQRLLSKEIPSLLNNLLRCYRQQTPQLLKLEKMANARFQGYLMYGKERRFLHATLTKKRTVCFLTGRSRSVYRAFHLSRLKIREFAALGFFSGLSKASW